MQERDFRKHFIIVVAFSAFTALFWHRLLFSGLIPFDVDTLCFYYPNWAIGRRLLETGSLLWDPYRNFGQSFIGVPQAQALYPLRFLSPWFSFAAYTKLSIVFHSALAAGFAYLLARRRGASEPAATVCALAFGFAGPFFMRVVFPADFATIAWLPCAIYCLDIRKPVFLSAALAVQWFAGYPPLFLVCLLILAANASLQEDPRGAWRTLAVAVPLAGALAAVQGFPFLEMLRLSSRDVLLNTNEAVINSTHPIHLLRGLFLPSFLHHVFPMKVFFRPMFYIGPFITGFAFLAAWRGGRAERALLAVAGAFFFLSLGRFNGITEHVGILHVFRYQGNWTLGGTACLALLAVRGISGLASPKFQWIAMGVIAVDLLTFAWMAPHTAGDATFVTEINERLPGFETRPQGRVLHAEEILDRYPDWNWDSPASWPLLKRVLLPSYGTVFGIREVASHHNLTSRSAQNLRRRLNFAKLDPALFDVADVERVISITPEGLKAAIPDSNQFRVLANPNHHGHAFVLGASSSTAQVSVDLPGRFSGRATGPGRFVFSEGTAPGWRATVDGKVVAIETYEDALMSFPLSAGPHDVALVYRPVSFVLGSLISLIGLFIAAGLCFYRRVEASSLAPDELAQVRDL